MTIRIFNKCLFSALFIVMPIIKCAVADVEIPAKPAAAGRSETSVPAVYKEMMEVLNAFEAKEEDILVFIESVQAQIAAGTQPSMVEGMLPDELTRWCGATLDFTSRNLENIRLGKAGAGKTLLSKEGALHFFNDQFGAYLSYLKAREGSLNDYIERKETQGMLVVVSTLPGTTYSSFNEYIKQGTIDHFHFLSLILKVLYKHLKEQQKQHLSLEAKAFLRCAPAFRNFLNSETDDFDLNLDELVLGDFRSYSVKAAQKAVEDEARRHGISGTVVCASLDPATGKVTGIPHDLDPRERRRLVLQLRQQAKVLDDKKNESKVEKPDLTRKEKLGQELPQKKKKRSKHRRAKDKKRPEAPVAADVLQDKVAIVTAPVPVSDDEEDDDDAVAVAEAEIDHYPALAAAHQDLLETDPGAPVPVSDDEEDDDNAEAAAAVAHYSTRAAAPAPAPAPERDARSVGAILRGRAKEYFASFWDPRSTGAGLNFDKEFIPLFQQLGGRIKFAGGGSSHCTLYYNGFKPEGAWRPHPKPELGHRTMLRLRGYFEKWGLTMERLVAAA